MSAKFLGVNARKIEEVIHLIQEGNLALFCGAGISLNPPSNLPSAGALRKAILERFIEVDMLASEIRMLLEEGVAKEKGTTRPGVDNVDIKRYYPFEAFIQIVDRNVPILETLVEIYKEGEPNKNHTLIAELMKQGYVKEVLTTNFDTKIEDALEKVDGSEAERWKKDVDFKVLSKEADFLETDFSLLKCPVILKIHGTIEDKGSIRTTLTTISSKELREARARVLRHFFQEADHDILIMGYSGSDEFDINPVLRGLDSETRIFLLKHLRRDSKEKPRVFPLDDPFHGFKGVMIQCNTEDFIDILWENLVGKFWKDLSGSEAWKQVIEEWSRGLQEGLRLYTAADILFD